MIPYDKRSGKIWYNNELVDWADVKLHVLSHGMHYASCVFEGERVYDGSIFKLEEHTARFFHSARRMGFEIPYTEEEINNASNKIIATQKVENGYVRPVAFYARRTSRPTNQRIQGDWLRLPPPFGLLTEIGVVLPLVLTLEVSSSLLTLLVLLPSRRGGGVL